MSSEVIGTEPAADALEIGVDRLCDRPLVVRVAATFRDEAIGTRQVGIAEHGSRRGSLAVGVNRVVDLFNLSAPLAEIRHAAPDVVSDHVGDRRAGLGHMDGGREEGPPI